MASDRGVVRMMSRCCCCRRVVGEGGEGRGRRQRDELVRGNDGRIFETDVLVRVCRAGTGSATALFVVVVARWRSESSQSQKRDAAREEEHVGD